MGKETMTQVLNIIRRRDDDEAVDIARQQAASGEASLLCLHDAVYRAPEPDLPTFASRPDVEARGIESQCRLVSDEEIVQLIFDHEKVICW
jgi:sulfur transfer complex TusBCD TusB component (DsrH family)